MHMIKLALSKYGVKEVPGEKNNPEILKFFYDIGHTWVQSEDTAWCSAFVNWVAKKSGNEYSGKLNARSWLDVGEPIEGFHDIGDVVILWREDPLSWKGHVGLFIRETKSSIYVLGGNQDNRVCIKPYPRARLLGYRRLQKKL